jgi:adenosyl cobinamide kinase/adenosyl cobinamide phosphate guanylyltransferase
MTALWVVGEAKSGKSELAEEFFARLPGKKFYIGTLPRTPRWMEAIRKHAERRPEDWQLIEITDELDVATESIRYNSKNEVVAVLLDGWGVYARCRTSQWSKENAEPSVADATRFVQEIYAEYGRLVNVCDYLVIVAHISAHPPTASDYESDRITSRVRALSSRCIAEADKVIYHDLEDVSDKDKTYIERIVSEMVGQG